MEQRNVARGDSKQDFINDKHDRQMGITAIPPDCKHVSAPVLVRPLWVPECYNICNFI